MKLNSNQKINFTTIIVVSCLVNGENKYKIWVYENNILKENEHLKLGDALTVKMKKRHSMPNLLQVPGNATIKQSETFDSKLRLRKKHTWIVF